jgi:glutathione S-transferase
MRAEAAGAMITLYSYPGLFGVADNNPYGLKVYAFLKLADLPFVHEHLFDASAAPRGQLPYIEDDGETIGDSDTIIARVTRKHGVRIDEGLGETERDVDLLIGRMLDDLYWVMSYSRWRDDAFWPAFRDALLSQHPGVTPEALAEAREYNFKRYHFHGIGRYEPAAAYARGLADLKALADLVPPDGWLHGARPTSIDAAIYGFIANIWFYPIETPLRAFLAGRDHLIRHCEAIHLAISPKPLA